MDNSSNIEYVIAGLGNYEDKYKNTRHNIGFIALDYISKKLNINIKNNKFKSLFKINILNNKKIIFLKPQTFMNLSGEAILEVMNFYKIPSERVLLIFDDVYLPVGKIRIKKSGSHGGQNGIKNIINLCKTDEFPRIKIGVGEKPNINWDLADWVLSEFSNQEKDIINNILISVNDSVNLIVNNQIEQAMNKYN